MTTAKANAPKIALVLDGGELIVVDPSFFLHDGADFGEQIKNAVRSLLKGYDPDQHFALVEMPENGEIATYLKSRTDTEQELADAIDNSGVMVPEGLTPKQVKELYSSCKTQ